MPDNDAKFSGQFDEVLKSSGAIVKRSTPLSPNLRAHVERFIQTLKFECLNKFVIVAEKHLDHICRFWSRHYNEERPHSAREHLPPDFTSAPEEATTVRVNNIVCTSKHRCSQIDAMLSILSGHARDRQNPVDFAKLLADIPTALLTQV